MEVQLNNVKIPNNKLQEEQLAMIKDKADGAALTLEDVSGMSYGLKVRHCKLNSYMFERNISSYVDLHFRCQIHNSI